MNDTSKQIGDCVDQLMHEELWAEAKRLIESCPDLLRKDARLRWKLGWVYFKLGDFEAAQRHLSRAVKLDPTSGHSWWALGIAQLEDGLLAKAECNIKEALRRDDSTIFRTTLAVVLMRRGKIGEAEELHLSGLDLKPESPERWQAYTCFLDDLGRQDEAQGAYANARMFAGH